MLRAHGHYLCSMVPFPILCHLNPSATMRCSEWRTGAPLTMDVGANVRRVENIEGQVKSLSAEEWKAFRE